jgi:hypothetical protein
MVILPVITITTADERYCAIEQFQALPLVIMLVCFDCAISYRWFSHACQPEALFVILYFSLVIEPLLIVIVAWPWPLVIGFNRHRHRYRINRLYCLVNSRSHQPPLTSRVSVFQPTGYRFSSLTASRSHWLFGVTLKEFDG